MSHQPSPGPVPPTSVSAYQAQANPALNPNTNTNRKQMKPYAPSSGIGIAAGAEDAKYKAKYKELRKKVKEIEADNDKLLFKTLQAKRNIQRMRIERAIIYERLAASAQQSHPHDLPPAHAPPPAVYVPSSRAHAHYPPRDLHDPYVGEPHIHDPAPVENWYRHQNGGAVEHSTAMMTPPAHPGAPPPATSSRHASGGRQRPGSGHGHSSHSHQHPHSNQHGGHQQQQNLPSLSSIQHLEPPPSGRGTHPSHPHDHRSSHEHSHSPSTPHSRTQSRAGGQVGAAPPGHVSGYTVPGHGGAPVSIDAFAPPPEHQAYVERDRDRERERERERSVSGRSRRSDIHELAVHPPSPGSTYIPATAASVSGSIATSVPTAPPPSIPPSTAGSIAPSVSASHPRSPSMSHSQASSGDTRGGGHVHRHQRMGPGTNINNVLPPGHEQEYAEKERQREMNDRERAREWEHDREMREARRSGRAGAEYGHASGSGSHPPPQGDMYAPSARSTRRSRSRSIGRRDEDEPSYEREWMMRNRGEDSYARAERADDVAMEDTAYRARRGGSP